MLNWTSLGGKKYQRSSSCQYSQSTTSKEEGLKYNICQLPNYKINLQWVYFISDLMDKLCQGCSRSFKTVLIVCNSGHGRYYCINCKQKDCIKCKLPNFGRQKVQMCSYCNRNVAKERLNCKIHSICAECFYLYKSTKCKLCVCDACLANNYEYKVSCPGKHRLCKKCLEKGNSRYCIVCQKNEENDKNKCYQCMRELVNQNIIASCKHKICDKCVLKAIQNQSDMCLCRKPIIKEQLEKSTKRIFAVEKTKKYNLNCSSCAYTQQQQFSSAPEYYKCVKCSQLSCLIHNKLLAQCKCRCQKCLKQKQCDCEFRNTTNLPIPEIVLTPCNKCNFHTRVSIQGFCKFCFLLQNK